MAKRIFITGASTGLGKATAKLFASKGWSVIATMRKPEKENDLNNVKRRTIYRHIAFLYALKDSLRGEEKGYFKKFLTPKEAESVQAESNIHNAILNNQSKDLEYMNKMEYINGYKFIEFNRMIVKFCDGMGMSERINNTVFPTTYIFYTRVFIWL